MLKIKSLIHSYGPGTEIKYPDWEVDQGDHAMIVGNSGSGKTTLLHLIGALLRPFNGEVWIGKDNLSSMNQVALDHYRGNNIGIIFQKPHLVQALNVKENLLLAQKVGTGKTDAQKIEEVLSELDISAVKLRKTHQMSQGQAQRVSVARALMNHPKILLADEPTASLDDMNCEHVISLLKSQAEGNRATLIVATHDQRVKGEFQNRLEL